MPLPPFDHAKTCDSLPSSRTSEESLSSVRPRVMLGYGGLWSVKLPCTTWYERRFRTYVGSLVRLIGVEVTVKKDGALSFGHILECLHAWLLGANNVQLPVESDCASRCPSDVMFNAALAEASVVYPSAFKAWTRPLRYCCHDCPKTAGIRVRRASDANNMVMVWWVFRGTRSFGKIYNSRTICKIHDAMRSALQFSLCLPPWSESHRGLPSKAHRLTPKMPTTCRNLVENR